MSEPTRELDVLVVGAGPTGLTLASELLRHGASARIIDELASPVVYSKAAVVHARTMELFDAMGVVGPILERQDDAGVTATVEGPSGRSEIRARWLVGGDGAHSMVRKTAGFSFEGAPYASSCGAGVTSRFCSTALQRPSRGT
jgi:2-polyprenyl-6-methoxyphenol hydroxylase-like FAD-dependent oxidoreductase